MQTDIAAAVDFYKTLGLTLKFYITGKWAEFTLGSVTIALCPTDDALDERRTGAVFTVPDIWQLYTTHKNSLSFISEPVDGDHGCVVSVKDPGGNIIDLYQPHHVNRQPIMQAEPDGCCRGTRQCEQ